MLKITIRASGPAGSGKTLAIKALRKILKDNDFEFEEGSPINKEGNYIKARRKPLTNDQFICARYKHLTYVRF